MPGDPADIKAYAISELKQGNTLWGKTVKIINQITS